MQAHRGAAASGEQAKQTAHPPKTDASQSGRPGGFTRRNSFGNTLYKFTDRANSFGHRRRMTTATLTSSSTLPSISLTQSHQSHLPTPSGIPRSSSFFGSLDAFVTPNVDENANPSTPNASGTRRYRKVSEKFIQLPFFSHQNQSHLPQRALSPRTKRESSIKIEHRGLMAPIQPVSLPRSSTMDNVTQQRGILASPSFMHPTSSSANRRQSMTLSKRPQLPMPHYTSSSTAVIQPHWSMHGRRRQSVNSPLCKELGTPLASSSSTNCFPIWKESVSSRYSPPPRAAAPAAKTSSMVHRAAATHDSTLARTTQVPTATQVPTPTVPLLTPEYENSDEDERDKRATCSQAHLRPGNGDESGMTATQFDDEPEMVCCPICSQNVLDEGHRQACTIFYQSKNIFEGQGSNDAERGSELTDHVIDSDSPPYIHEAKPTNFWLGRHTSLSDRLRTEGLSSALYSPNLSSLFPSITTRFEATGMLDNVHRNKNIFSHLHSLCATEEARLSLKMFKVEYEAEYGVDGEARKRLVSTSSTAGKVGLGGEGSKEEKKGKGWLNAFKGRNRG